MARISHYVILVPWLQEVEKDVRMPGVKTESNTNQTEAVIADQTDSVSSLKWAIPVGIIVTTILSFLPATP